jgi:hypothetical protein
MKGSDTPMLAELLAFEAYQLVDKAGVYGQILPHPVLAKKLIIAELVRFLPTCRAALELPVPRNPKIHFCHVAKLAMKMLDERNRSRFANDAIRRAAYHMLSQEIEGRDNHATLSF